MKRYAFVAALLCLASAAAQAQPPGAPARPVPPYGSGGYTPTAPVVVPRPRPMFTTTPNVFNYDSGDYLLGGFDGYARAQGSFTMGFPTGAAPAACQSCRPWLIPPQHPVITVFDVVKP